MSDYKHGIYGTEVKTKLPVPKRTTAGIQFVVDASAINLATEPKVNEVVLCNSMEDVEKYLGYKEDMKFGISQSAYASFKIQEVAPVIYVNICNPETHKTAITEEELNVVNHEAVVNADDIIASSLEVVAGSSTLVLDTDYKVEFNAKGKAVISLIASSTHYNATTLTVNGYKLDLSLITEAQVIAGINKIKEIYPKYNTVGTIIVSPNFSCKANVASAMQTVCEKINGTFRAECFVDISSKEAETIHALTKDDVETAKNQLGLVSAHCYAGWLCGKVNGLVIKWSALVGALAQRLAYDNGDIPYNSPSNKLVGVDAICKDDGTEMLLDFVDANAINALGIATFINSNGVRNWGNNTVVFPSSTDPKDRWINCRMMFTWKNNIFVLNNLLNLDNLLNKRLIDSIVDNENIFGNGLVANGMCAVSKIEYHADDNTEADLVNGKIKFRQFYSPYTPAECIENITEYDTKALADAINE